MTLVNFSNLINLISQIFVAVITLFIRVHRPEPFFKPWTNHYLSMAGFMLVTSIPHFEKQPFLLLLAVIFVGLTIGFMANTANHLQAGAWPEPLTTWFLGSLTLGCSLLAFGGIPFNLLIAPFALLLSVVVLRLGFLFLRPKDFPKSSIGFFGVAWPLLLLGIIPFFYPALHGTPLEWLGSGLSTIVQLTLGFGMILFLFEKQEHQLRAVTAEKILLQETQIEALKQTERLKDEFLAVVGHEFRTPLTTVLGYNEILLQEDVPIPREARKDYLQRIQQAALRLRRLINDLLDYTRLESQSLRFDLQPRELQTELRFLLDTFEDQAAAKGIDLITDLPQAPLGVLMDGERIEQVLGNLLENAVKFTPKGGEIRLSAEPLPETVRIIVRDTGIGISEEAFAKIFQRFYQVESAKHHSISGMGLGLAIAKGIVDAHGGEIGLESEPGKGSTFWFTLRRTSEGVHFD